MVVALATNLKTGKTKSCGCLHHENAVATGKKSARHAMHSTPIYNTYHAMLQRCYNQQSKMFKHYGGRGITVCERWRESFENFLTDMGDRPDGLSLDRIDTNGNYEPSNCRWATDFEQNNNTRFNRPIEYNGRTKTVAEWARELEWPHDVLLRRLNKWSVSEAFERPYQGYRNKP
jgi:hypothetical protein